MILRVEQRTRDNAWIEPTMRQLAILTMLADDHNDASVAAWMCLSVRTVQRDMNQLASANGAGQRITAGALFESLGWTRRLTDRNVPRPAPQLGFGHDLATLVRKHGKGYRWTGHVASSRLP